MSEISELPVKPTGWKKKLLMHMNFGRDGGAASYSIHDENGDEMPISYQYDTRKGGLTGFALDGIDGVMTWAELRAAWPEWNKQQKAAA